MNIFAFGFAAQAGLPKVVPKITRADMGLVLPRLDDPIVDTNGDPDIHKKRARDALIEKYRAIYVLGGRVVSTKPTAGKDKDNPGVRFVGSFKAIVNPALANQNVGTYFVSSRMHVPKFFEEVLYAQVLQAQLADKTATLELLIGVGLKSPNPAKPSITGYEWTVEPLVDMSAADDPVDALFARGKERVALAAPTVNGAAESADTTAPKAATTAHGPRGMKEKDPATPRA
jgi:hypothetical protein